MPTGSQGDEPGGLIDYRSFLEYNIFDAVYSTLIWAMLIFITRWKRGQPHQKRAGTHFLAVQIYIVYRIFSVMLLAFRKPYSEFAAMATHCLRGVAFLSVTCAPLGVAVVFPVIELLLAGVIAFLIRKRAIAKHGTAQVDTPPPPPKLVAAWKLGEIMELDDEQGECSIGLKV
ncbi:hypothetical protein FB45DRAFT_223168 [Roridomyces roridus]|uniref:Uncharacterized protein n=1 Tax=Roridomyces roridus TaxID=1738132 RepID=A0AAD7BCC4_9AGAR|nr:hypothetical protein FB45DRAFT_223168 [Roridomyces roridus]